MYDDLTRDEVIELVLEHKLRSQTVPQKLRDIVGQEDMEIIEGLYDAVEE